jgi:mannose-6-phosphate isomerase class I
VSLLRLEPAFRDYAWGDAEFIPRLLGREPDGRPWAEAWFGAHPAAPSRVRTGEGVRGLDAVLRDRPEQFLGAGVSARFGSLPYLVKYLAAAQPLSLQVHPDAVQARAGWAREEAAGIPRDAPHRSYRDDRHKPELLVALSGFRALCGFRSIPDCARALDSIPELARLLPAPSDGLAPLLAAWFELPAATREPALAAMLARLAERDRRTPFPETSPEHWALRARQAGGAETQPDPGLLLVFLLELVELAPGEGIFLDAGVPHAYLQGAGIEVMASSDNVLRAGLTSKHVDPPELLRVLRCDAPAVPRIRPDADGIYRTPAAEFELSVRRLTPDKPLSLETSGPEVLLVPRGRVRLEADDGSRMELTDGAGAMVAAGTGVRVAGADATLYRVRVAPG